MPALLAVATATKTTATPVSSSSGIDATANVADAAEYALWLTMDVLGGVLRRWGKGAVVGGGGSPAAERLYKRSAAGDDAEMVLTCVRENPSPQTRQVPCFWPFYVVFCVLYFVQPLPFVEDLVCCVR